MIFNVFVMTWISKHLPIIVPGDICSYSSSVKNKPSIVELDVNSVVVDDAFSVRKLLIIYSV